MADLYKKIFSDYNAFSPTVVTNQILSQPTPKKKKTISFTDKAIQGLTYTPKKKETTTKTTTEKNKAGTQKPKTNVATNKKTPVNTFVDENGNVYKVKQGTPNPLEKSLSNINYVNDFVKKQLMPANPSPIDATGLVQSLNNISQINPYVGGLGSFYSSLFKHLNASQNNKTAMAETNKLLELMGKNSNTTSIKDRATALQSVLKGIASASPNQTADPNLVLSLVHQFLPELNLGVQNTNKFITPSPENKVSKVSKDL